MYSHVDAELLGSPIPLALDELCCDVYGCDAAAVNILPGCALCHDHSLEYGIGSDDTYSVPLDALVGGPDWRAARLADYRDRAASLPPIPRDVRRDRLLEQLASQRVDDLLREE
jgi:hypothetical protein